jgi:predicted ABC-type transport system involved in lysophospholipase L1 biosynthesis ATPase subunit
MTRLEARNVRVDQRHGPLLPATSLRVATGQLVLLYGDPGPAHAALALALAGRLPIDEGVVTLDGVADPAVLQDAVGLVDVPEVSAPDDVLPLTTVTGEGLAMAREPAGRRDVRDWLTKYGLGHRLEARMEDLTAPERLRVLSLLTASRPGVLFLVVTLPERNGHVGDLWLPGARQLTDAGFGLVVTTSVGVAGRVRADHPGLQVVAIGDDEEAEDSDPAAGLLDATPPMVRTGGSTEEER